MTPEEKRKLQQGRWLLRARTLRPTIASAIAKAIQVEETKITFADLDTTNQVSGLFAQRARGACVKELPNRSAAIEFAKAQLTGTGGPAFLLPDGYDDCGVVPIDFAVAIGHLDALLASQNEIFRLVQETGEAGVCIFKQEGRTEFYPRFVELWRTTAADQIAFLER